MNIFSPVTQLPGIGKTRAAQLAKLNIQTLYDLICFYPHSYDDRTQIRTISELQPESPASFNAMVVTQPRVSASYRTEKKPITTVTVADATGRLKLSFFNRPYLSSLLRYGESYFFYGTPESGLYATQMVNPAFEPEADSGRVTRCILPVYPLTQGLSNRQLATLIQRALNACLSELVEILPDEILKNYDLCDAAFAFRVIHSPRSFIELERARKRLIFDEFFIFCAGLTLLRGRRAAQGATPYRALPLAPFLEALPFSPTDAQRRAMKDVECDLCSDRPMNRLLQGDVGSGKTVVAAWASFLTVQNGKQVALMAPTEILAEQHAATLQGLLEPLGVRTVLLTGSKSAAAKREIKQQLATGEARLAIGTHALLTENVVFSDLGLVIADEQHRFGVAQRAALTAKGDAPHLLVMSATPIPRTLSLIMFADLDVSVLDELPPGRQTVNTFVVGEPMRTRINAFIRKQVSAGHQVYIICPAVEDTETQSLKAVETWADVLRKTVFPDLRVGLLHGRLKGSEKEAIMRQFVLHELDILVSTTVIEVGIDVPNATLMVIENAERFGLSQLHQLRGRVGRGKDQAYCVLFAEGQSEALPRLDVLRSTNDGFQIAEKDLELRGPGDFFGRRQHGLPLLKVANLKLDIGILEMAREASRVFESADILSDPAYAPLIERIFALFSNQKNIFN